MTNIEIVKWLRELDPEDIAQKEKIDKAINVFLTEIRITSVDKYLDLLAYDEVYMKIPNRVYRDYKRYCEENNLKCESINLFSRTVRKTFHLKAQTVRNYGELKRLYLDIED